MMKRVLLIATTLFLAATAVYSQNFSIGASVGTDGIGVDFAASLSDKVQARVGYSLIAYSLLGSQNVSIQAWKVHPSASTTLKETGGTGSSHLLFDYFPGESSAFHLTGGLFFGSPTILKVQNTTALPDSYHTAGIDYYPGGREEASNLKHFYSDNNGIMTAELRRNALRPYIGIGFGSPFAGKSIGVTFDLGVEYTGGIGSYGVTNASSGSEDRVRLDSDGVMHTIYDMRGGQKTKSYDTYIPYLDKLYKIPVLPVCRLSIFFGQF